MPHTGNQINVKQALALCYHVGFRNQRLSTAVAVMQAESARYIGAYYINVDENGVPLSADRGLFQINSLHKSLTDEEAFCPIPNAEYAFRLSMFGRNFTPWAAYNSGAYLTARPLIEEIRQLGEWRAINVPKKFAPWCAPVPDEVAAL